MPVQDKLFYQAAGCFACRFRATNKREQRHSKTKIHQFFSKTYGVGIHQNRLDKMILMSTHDIGFYKEFLIFCIFLSYIALFLSEATLVEAIELLHYPAQFKSLTIHKHISILPNINR